MTVQGADQGDTTTIAETVTAAAEDLEAVAAATDGETAVIEEVVADKGYHSNQVLVDLAALDLRTYIAEPDRGRRRWKKKAAARDAVYANRRRIHGGTGLGLVAATQRTPGTAECASLRNGQTASHAFARPHEHPETVVGARQWVQLGPLHADAVRDRHAPQSAGAARGRCALYRRALDPRRRPLAHRETLFADPSSSFTPHHRFELLPVSMSEKSPLATAC